MVLLNIEVITLSLKEEVITLNIPEATAKHIHEDWPHRQNMSLRLAYL